jgi:hypothetical protein
MKTAFALKPGEFEAGDAKLGASFCKHGECPASTHAENGKPGLSYTTGHWYMLDFAQLIVFSVQLEVPHQFFWDVNRAVARAIVPRSASGRLPFGASARWSFSPLPRRIFWGIWASPCGSIDGVSLPVIS